MIEYRKNNYFRPTGTGSIFNIDISPILREPKTYCEELILNAQQIWENKEGKVYILYSGGIDSEVMLEVFLSLKMDFTPVIVDLQPNLNKHDLDYAFKYCKKRNIQPLVISINLVDFAKSDEFLTIADLAETGTVEYIPTMKAALSLDGTVLCGNEEPYLSPENGLWYYQEKETWTSWGVLYKKGILTGTSAFHTWTPESLLAFMLDPTIIELGNNRLPGKLGSFSSRSAVYGRMFPLDPRPKFTGWEHINTLDEINSLDNIKILKKRRTTNNGLFKIEYNTLVSLLKGNYGS